jgi:ubiquinol-cytochrome c reductase cytochrome c subunit
MNTLVRLSAVIAITFAAGAVALAQGAAPSGDAGRGKQLYMTVGCWSCHGTVGQGGGGRTGGLRLAQMGIAFPAFLNQLRQPVDEMPPYVASVLPDRDVADIYAYIASLPPPPDLKSIPILNQ